jgi:threonine synthase
MERLICQTCDAEYSTDEPIWRCACGSLLDLEYTPELDLDLIASRKPNLWRYREALPLPHGAELISFDEGFTPLVPVDFGGRRVLVKLDQLFTTGSYKDRGAAVMISKVKQLGVREVVEDSSGNAGCAVAAYSARADVACRIYVPASTSAGKLVQIQSYGAALERVPGSREATAAAVLEAAETIYYASHAWNPYFFHGTKTFAYEVCEQLGWQAPDTVVLPAAHGTLLLGAWIGFNELLEAGIIRRLPKLVAVQSDACPPLYQAFVNGEDRAVHIEKRDSLAEGIAVAEPVRDRQILQAVRASGGTFVAVSEQEILASFNAMARQGYYIEPTTAAVTAGVSQYLLGNPPEETIVSVFTGHGLKATDKIMKLVGVQ